MTRFEQEMSGALGEFWTKHAEEEIAKMQERVDNHEIGTNMNGAAFWNSNGKYLPDDVAEKLSYGRMTVKTVLKFFLIWSKTCMRHLSLKYLKNIGIMTVFHQLITCTDYYIKLLMTKRLKEPDKNCLLS